MKDFKEEADDLLVFILRHSDKSPEFVSKYIEEHLRKSYWEGQLEGYKEGKMLDHKWSEA
jgi:hypothetical protein